MMNHVNCKNNTNMNVEGMIKWLYQQKIKYKTTFGGQFHLFSRLAHSAIFLDQLTLAR